MTTFPTIRPNNIAFDMGRSNISEVDTFAGPVRFRHSQRINGHTLRMTYNGLSQSQVDAIRTHYFQNQGTHGYFDVPGSLWGGLSVVDEDAIYRYTQPPEEQHTGLHYNVSVALRIIDGTTLVFILEGNGAVQPALAPFSSFAFNGTAPFILECNGAAASATLVLDSSGASL
jgi:hypothetical protein